MCAIQKTWSRSSTVTYHIFINDVVSIELINAAQRTHLLNMTFQVNEHITGDADTCTFGSICMNAVRV